MSTRPLWPSLAISSLLHSRTVNLTALTTRPTHLLSMCRRHRIQIRFSDFSPGSFPKQRCCCNHAKPALQCKCYRASLDALRFPPLPRPNPKPEPAANSFSAPQTIVLRDTSPAVLAPPISMASSRRIRTVLAGDSQYTRDP